MAQFTSSSSMHPLLAYTESQIDWLLDTLEALVRSESPSHDKAAVDRCGLELAARLRAIGATVEVIQQHERGNHLRASIAGDGQQVLLLGHFDTVWRIGQIAATPYREDGGRLYGPGIFDMKAGIAVALLALRALEQSRLPHPPVVMLWTTDEEIGSGSSRALIEAEAQQSRAVLVLEPSLPGGKAKTGRKGVGEFELIVHGVAAHAGIAPNAGANAVHELARQIVALTALGEEAVARGVSLNVTVAAGGERTNVIPDRARAIVDVRVPGAAEARRLESAIRALTTTVPGTRLEIRGGINRPPLERTADVAALFAVARDAAAELGKDLGEGATGGGSDGNFTGALGVPTLDGLGPDGDGAHALHEHVLLSDLRWRPAFVAGLLSRLTAFPTR